MKIPDLPRTPVLQRPSRLHTPLRTQIACEDGVKLENICRSNRRNRQGAAAVEFAFIAPVFFLLIFGMIEFGRMLMVQQVITNASREGARLGVLDVTTPDEVDGRVREYLEKAGIEPQSAQVDVVPDPLSAAGYGDRVEVKVSIPFREVSWLPSPMLLGGDTVLTATTIMRRETVQ